MKHQKKICKPKEGGAGGRRARAKASATRVLWAVRMPPADYQKVEVVGEGTFGVVTRANVIGTGKVVAIKKIRSRASKRGAELATLRETMLLQELRHEHVVELLEAYTQNGSLSLVFEFCTTDLEKVQRGAHVGRLRRRALVGHAACGHRRATPLTLRAHRPLRDRAPTPRRSSATGRRRSTSRESRGTLSARCAGWLAAEPAGAPNLDSAQPDSQTQPDIVDTPPGVSGCLVVSYWHSQTYI